MNNDPQSVTVKTWVVAYIVITSLCLDSLLKIPVGENYLHFSIILSLAFIFFLGLQRPGSTLRRVGAVANDKGLLLIATYAAVHVVFAMNISVFFTLYLYIAFFVLMYIIANILSDKVNWRSAAEYALILLIVTGFVQYALANLFGFQLELRGLDASYYSGKGDLGYRMRGFFLEPNWFGLALYSWLYLYIRETERFNKRFSVVATLALATLYISNNRLILVLVCLLFLGLVIPKRSKVLNTFFALGCVIAAVALYLLFSVDDGGIEDRSATARLYTSAAILTRWNESDLLTKIIGNGFSNWGFYSNKFGFSKSNYLMDQSLTRRDNAEIYVFLFEMGVLSFLIFGYDILRQARRSIHKLDLLFVCSIYLSGLFYPVFTFIYYLFPYLVVRAKLNAQVRGRAR